MSLDALPAAAAPSATVPARHRFTRFGVVALQLGLILAAVHLFDIEGRRHFFAVLCLAVVGFAVHAWLPRPWRTSLFVALSAAAYPLVLGAAPGVMVLGIGATLIGFCYLPLAVLVRAAALVTAGLVLAFFRDGSGEPYWPVLGSLFMFRLFLFFRDLRRARARPPVPLALAYFFVLPNVCFLFFPVFDFETFRDTYRDDDAPELWQSGVAWIVRGIGHLLVYRWIRLFVLPSPFELADAPHLLLFLVSNYALYLHVSGQFHIITGMLHLFGFGLPRTHHNYFLASSFTDIWRRINVYWKDFMMRVFFLPAFFALRGWGTVAATAAAVLLVFTATWILHAYQVFWLLGEFTLRASDAALWLVLALLAFVNLQWDLRRARAGAKSQPQPTAARTALHGVQVVGMFLLVSLFWAAWTLPGFLRQLPDLGGSSDLLPALGFVVAAAGIAASMGIAWHALRTLVPALPQLDRSPVLCVAALLVLLSLGSPPASALLGERGTAVLALMRRDGATPLEAAQQARGYYEEVTAPRVRAGGLLRALEGNPLPPHGAQYLTFTRPVDPLLERELIPDWSGVVAGKPFRVNHLGLRDLPTRTEAKPGGTCRVTLVGSSVLMGYGVGDDAVFARLVEGRLEEARLPNTPHCEMLNFGTGLSSATHRRVLIERRVVGFRPDALWYFAHQDEIQGAVRHLAKLVAGNTPLPSPAMQGVVHRSGLNAEASLSECESRLRPLGRELVEGLYREIAGLCRERGIVPVWIYLPVPGVQAVPVQVLAEPARSAGFLVLDLGSWHAGRAADDVLIGPGDFHPNELGHRLLADRLLGMLREVPAALPCATKRGD